MVNTTEWLLPSIQRDMIRGIPMIQVQDGHLLTRDCLLLMLQLLNSKRLLTCSRIRRKIIYKRNDMSRNKNTDNLKERLIDILMVIILAGGIALLAITF